MNKRKAKVIPTLLVVISMVVGVSSLGHRECRDVEITEETQTSKSDYTSCSIIYGHLKIQLVDLHNFSLPNLVMVTDYVLVHRTTGLVSLAELLPRLTVIRGINLLYGHALLLISNFHLEELGSLNIQTIMRGSVHLESNIMMCTGSPNYWKKITHRNYTSKNSFLNNHPWCPFDNCEEQNFCEVPPKACSKIPQGCPNIEGLKCHRECIGGCLHPNSTMSCTACRHFENMEGKCVPICLANQLKYLNYLCISRDYCHKQNGVSHSPTRECLQKCPEGFAPSTYSDGKLRRCIHYRSSSKCPSQKVTSINSGEKVKRCSSIEGNLDIELSHKADWVKLNENFSKLKVVTGYVSIVGSNSLYSLNFLKNLQRIGGNETFLKSPKKEGYALYIMNNANLKELWDWDVRQTNLTIGGKIYVRFNDLLCPQHVQYLQRATGVSDKDLDAGSNGKGTQCKVFISAICAKTTEKAGEVDVSWKHVYNGMNIRAFLGYNIHYRATQANISKYEGRDACNYNSSWNKLMFKITDDLPNNVVLTQRIGGLMLNQRYAFYIESFALGKEQNSVQTNITYITVKEPPAPATTSIQAVNNSILLNWTQSMEPISFYHLSITVKQGRPNVAENSSENSCSKTALVSKGNQQNSRPTYLSRIECPHEVNKERMYELRQHAIDISNAISSHFLFRIKPATESSSSVTVYERKASVKNMPSNETVICDSDLRPFNVTQADGDWHSEDNTHELSLVTNKSSIALNLHEMYSPDIPSFMQVKIKGCHRNENAGVMCRNYSSADTFNGENFHGELHNVEDLSLETIANLTHPCSNMSELRQSAHIVRITWDDILFMDSYKVVIDNYETSPREICISRRESEELGTTCWLNVSSQNPYEINVTGLIADQEIVLFHKAVARLQSPWTLSYIMSCIGTVVLACGILSGLFGFSYYQAKRSERTMKTHYNTEYAGHCIPTEEPVYSEDNSRNYDERTSLNRIQEERDSTEDLEQIHEKWFTSNSILRLDELRTLNLVWQDEVIEKKRLGCGEFGTVYEGRLRRNPDIKIAYKTLNKDYDKAIKEAMRVLCLDSPFIVKCLGLKFDCGYPQIVFEHMSRGNVKSQLGSGKVTSKMKLKIALDLSKALKYLWQLHIVHGDIACRNILTDDDQNFKLADFGLAQRLLEEAHNIQGCSEEFAFLMSNAEVWTPKEDKTSKYTSPEVINNRHARESDTWSFGFLIMELCTDGKDWFQIKEHCDLEKLITPISEFHEKLPEDPPEIVGFNEIMKLCLQYNPEDRITPSDLVKRIQLMNNTMETRSPRD